jgi:predicted metal-dependent hydrolase
MFFGRRASASETPSPFNIDLDGQRVTITPRRNASARRMVLRAARDGHGFALTLPRRHSQRAIQEFLLTSSDWMRTQLSKQPPKTSLEDGAALMLRGVDVTIQTTGKLRGTVAYNEESQTLSVPGAEGHIQRRLTDWLKQQALADLRQATTTYAAKMEVTYKRIAVRDQKSRWGSCTTDGTLSYSWRLVLAPPFVLDYVAAHEVAHLREMNHSPKFWRLVLTHCKDTRRAKSWLKQHGTLLHRAV